MCGKVKLWNAKWVYNNALDLMGWVLFACLAGADACPAAANPRHNNASTVTEALGCMKSKCTELKQYKNCN